MTALTLLRGPDDMSFPRQFRRIAFALPDSLLTVHNHYDRDPEQVAILRHGIAEFRAALAAVEPMDRGVRRGCRYD